MSDAYPEFEIVDRYGARWRYKRAEGYRWCWGLIPGTDLDNHDLAEVWLCPPDDPDAEGELVAEFPVPAACGDVTPNTCLNFNLRERPL